MKIEKLDKKTLDALLEQLKVIHSTENKTQKAVLAQNLHSKITLGNSVSYVAALTAFEMCMLAGMESVDKNFDFVYDNLIKFANAYSDLKKKEYADAPRWLDEKIRNYIR